MDMNNSLEASSQALDVETFAAVPFLPADERWAIRFSANETVTLVLGVRDYGGGWFSSYFAGLAASRLGIPYHRIRIYYSAQHPAALRTPMGPPALFRRGEIGPFANAIADIIEAMCDRVIEKGKLAFATIGSIACDNILLPAASSSRTQAAAARSRNWWRPTMRQPERGTATSDGESSDRIREAARSG